MIRILSAAAVLVSIGTAANAAAQSALPSADACTHWNVAGPWVLTQSNGPVIKMELQQESDDVLSGTAQYSYEGHGPVITLEGIGKPFGGTAQGPVEGTITGGSVTFKIAWDNGVTGQYTSRIEPTDRGLRGRTFDVADGTKRATFKGAGTATCTSVRPPAAAQTVSQVPHVEAQTKPVKTLGKASWTATAKDDVDIYSGPGGEFAVVGVLNAGVSAAIVGQKDDWYQLKLAAVPGGTGWVAGDHLNTVLIRPGHPR